MLTNSIVFIRFPFFAIGAPRRRFSFYSPAGPIRLQGKRKIYLRRRL